MKAGVQFARFGGLPASLLLATGMAASGRVEFAREFAPAEGWVKPVEEPYRQEICLNGRWQFQPMTVPKDWKRGSGIAPELPAPAADRWEPTPIKIPSPWNVNTWGAGRNVGEGTPHPYWPSSVYYPSYPPHWDGVEMGWLRRTFRLPESWGNRRTILHFEAVGGHAQVWVNGRKVGEHFDRYLPFEFDVTDLVRIDAHNELLVGVRSLRLFDQGSPKYKHMRTPYPPGSNTDHLTGIWQDVFLLGLPPVRVADVFVKPWVDCDILEAEVSLRNDSPREQTVAVRGSVQPWVNLAGTNVLEAPEPKWRLDPPVMPLPPHRLALKPGEQKTVSLSARVAGRLRHWSPETPNLHGLVLDLAEENRTWDRHYTRFGWRQYKIVGPDFLLNGQKVKMFGDLLHPFGPFIQSRRYVWAWYRMIQDMHGNAVRPHAQPHPRHYLDLADEMGLLVLDETAMFGSSLQLNFEAPAAWHRYAEHYDNLVRRDRNHPGVFGWSFGNELFAVFQLNQVSAEDADRWYERLAELGARARRLDPTREWISCDGDEDLRGTLPVWSKHFGHGTPLDRLPGGNKPLMVGESGGTYYARPSQLATFNGPRAYASYRGRNEALAIDVYDNIVRLARPRLTYFSASETAWFGLEHLNFGYHDFRRLPGTNAGVFFTAPFAEGKPGIQPERLPPYVATLNPGWDPALPQYRPLAMFHAQKAALALEGPQPCPCDHRAQPPRASAPPPPTRARVGFLGDRIGSLARRLSGFGVPLTNAESDLLVMDGSRWSEAESAEAVRALRSGKTVLLMLDRTDASALQRLNASTSMLPAPVCLTDRAATALVPDEQHPWTAPFTLPDLYFAEDGRDRFIMRRGLAGPLVDQGRILLHASDTDWSLFNHAPENAKCAAVILHERVTKPSGAALVECAVGPGKLVLCTLDHRVASKAANQFWRSLLTNMGIRLAAGESWVPAFDEHGALLQALSIGRFGAADLEAACATDFIGESRAQPTNGLTSGGLEWRIVQSPSRDRFVFREMDQTGPRSGPFAVYFSCSLRSPSALDDLLGGGPDMPRLTTFCYVSEQCRLFLNGEEIKPARTEPADYRTLYHFESLPLKKGWNHFVVKAVSRWLEGDRPGTLAVRIRASRDDFLRQLDSAIERPLDVRLEEND